VGVNCIKMTGAPILGLAAAQAGPNHPTCRS
jgi:hypothetical protein